MDDKCHIVAKLILLQSSLIKTHLEYRNMLFGGGHVHLKMEYQLYLHHTGS